MQNNDAPAIESFHFLLSQIAPSNTEPLYYYPKNSLERIRNEQMALFHEECIKEELLIREGSELNLTQKGFEAVKNGDASLILAPYYRAKRRINLLYVDILI